MMVWTQSSGTSISRSVSASSLRLTAGKKYVGERCKTVMWPHRGAMAGTRVAIVAPEPTTSTSLSP